MREPIVGLHDDRLGGASGPGTGGKQQSSRREIVSHITGREADVVVYGQAQCSHTSEVGTIGQQPALGTVVAAMSAMARAKRT